MSFWQEKTLEEMNSEEWESLCDGCSRCCLIKLEDEETDELHYTNIVCHLMNPDSCQCTRYSERSKLVPTCIKVTPEVARNEKWLPTSCAYRRLAEGHDLEAWHPLVSGDKNSVHDAGISVRGKCISEEFMHPEQYEDHLVEWPNET